VKAAFPTFMPASEVGYKIGTFDFFVPPWLADTVMIRPYGEYGMLTSGVHTKLNGGYWCNANSAASDPNVSLTTDLDYIRKYDLALLPGVKKLIIAFHWYTSLDQGNVANNNIVPAIGPEVQAWNWDIAPATGEYLVNPWTRANAYYLKATHQVWPTPDDNALFFGFEYLQNSGYQVGLCPIVTLMSNNFYYPGGGEWEVDRSLKKWTIANQAGFTQYLKAYQTFYRHYIDLFSQNSTTIPWIMYLGYGMRDITGCGVQIFLVQFVQMLQDLADYCKSKLPNTLVTYAADLDEYFYPYQVNADINNLDPLWTCNDLDFIGINWIAPLNLDDIEDNKKLEQGVLQGEADTFNLANFLWRGSTTDRLISTTTRNFKTGLTKVPISPLNRGVKEIIDWLSYYHYYPAINGILAGCTPLANIFPGDTRLCSHIHGVGPIGSRISLSPDVGGLAPIPDLPDTWAQIQLHSYMFLNFPAMIPDKSTFAFEINFEIDSALTNLKLNYRIFSTSFGLALDSINGTVTLWIPTITGSVQQVSLFSAAKGSVSLVYTQTSVQISVDGTFDLTVSPGTTLFKMPAPLDTLWMGNPQTAGVLPAGYGVWQGKIYFLSLILGAGDNQSGGQFFFDDTYCGIRTAWTPNLKRWMATAFGYASVRGSAVDPQTRVQTILSNQPSVVPNWYDDYLGVSAAVLRNNLKIKDIQGPYGSDFSIDEVYQAIVLNAAVLGIIEAGAVHQVAWFFDTRNGTAYKALMPNSQQIFNDAYDYEINSALNGKAAVRTDGTSLIYVPGTTVSEDLGLSVIPGELPYQKVILVEANVPQV
jgi:hypothetical protein